MFDSKSLDQLGPIADEMLGGLEADEAMRLKIVRAAAQGKAVRRAPARRLVPAICCAALAVCCVGMAVPRLNTNENAVTPADVPVTVSIDSIAAGEGAAFAGGSIHSIFRISCADVVRCAPSRMSACGS